MWILIFALATGTTSQTGSTTAAVEFSSREKCLAAGQLLTGNILTHGKAELLTIICVPK